MHDGEPGLGQDVAADQAGPPEKRRLESKSSAASRDQVIATFEKDPGPGDLERKQGTQLGRVVASEEGGFADAEPLALVFREVDSAALGVLGDILPVVQQLKAGADGVARFEGNRIPCDRRVEELDDQSTHGVGRVAAVPEKVLEIRVTYPFGVASERAKEGLKTADVEIVTPNFRGARPQRPVGRGRPLDGIEKCVLPIVDGLSAFGRSGSGLFFVRHVIGDADHGVDRGERPSRRSGQQPRADGEVLIVAKGEFLAAFEIREDRRLGGVGDG